MTFSRRGHTNERGGGGDDIGSVHNSTVTVDPHIQRERELELGFFPTFPFSSSDLREGFIKPRNKEVD